MRGARSAFKPEIDVVELVSVRQCPDLDGLRQLRRAVPELSDLVCVQRNDIPPRRDAEELELAKNKVAARLVLSAEKPRNRLGPLAYSWAYRETYHTVASELEELRAVTLGQIRALLEEYPLLPATTVLVGPLEEIAGVSTS